MAITNSAIDQAFSDLKPSCGGVRSDYFGLLYLEEELGLERDRALNQVAFGGNDYGVDGFDLGVSTRLEERARLKADSPRIAGARHCRNWPN